MSQPLRAAAYQLRKPSTTADPASLWESLSQGLDPTDSGPSDSGTNATGITQFGDCPTWAGNRAGASALWTTPRSPRELHGRGAPG